MAFLGKSAELLPPPLYILYSQLAACIDAHGIAAEVSIEGSVQEAEAAAAASLRLEAEVMAASVSEDREVLLSRISQSA